MESVLGEFRLVIRLQYLCYPPRVRGLCASAYLSSVCWIGRNGLGSSCCVHRLDNDYVEEVDDESVLYGR